MFKIMCSMVLFLISTLAMSANFVEGKDYDVIKSEAAIVHVGKTPQVTEFFSYGCPWCYRLEVPVSKWVIKQGNAIKFTKVPVVFRPDWSYYARAYYIVDSLKLGKTVHEALFTAIITDKQPMNTNQAMVEFFTKHGVDASVAESVFANSPSIELRLQADQALMAQLQINAIPSFVVNNQYKTNLQMAKSEARLFDILDYLVTIK